MNYRISDLLDGLEEAGQPLKPRGGSAARVKAQTLARIHEAEAPVRSVQPVPSVRRRFRPAAVLAAALAVVLLLSGTVFAAWKLGAFSYKEEFGPAGEILDSHAQSYDSVPEDADVIPADFGYAGWVKAELGDYNIVLLSLGLEGGKLHARVALSPKDERIPAFRDSGLTLSFLDYETESSARDMGWWEDRIDLWATPAEHLAADAEIVFSLSGPDGEAVLASFPLDAIERNSEALTARAGAHYATAARTQDYRFTLRSLTASPSAVYAVLDVEARTDWGAAHLDAVPEFAVSNRTSASSGVLLDARLLASGEGVRRYLAGFSSNSPVNQAGDSISFELLGLYEEGDTIAHPYYLFDVELESLVSGEILLTEPVGEPASNAAWSTANVNPMGMTLKGRLEGKTYEKGWPTATLVFRDGTREAVLYDDWRARDEPTTPHEARIADMTGNRDGTVRASLTFSQPLDPADLSAVIVDGQTFSCGE